MTRSLAATLTLLVLCSPVVADAQDGGLVPAETSRTSDANATDTVAHPSLGSIFHSLRNDFIATASTDNLVLLGIGASGALGAHHVDDRIASTPWGSDSLYRPGNIVGSTLAQGGGAFATYLVGRAFDAPRVSQLGSELVRAQIVAQTITQSVKIATTRTRPDGTSLSLPSGHTASAFATATVLQANFGWKAGVPAYAVAAWVGASRMQMKRHFLSDVVAGAAIGLVAGRSITVGRGALRFAVVPTAAPGGAGVTFVRVGSR